MLHTEVGRDPDAFLTFLPPINIRRLFIGVALADTDVNEGYIV